MSSISERILSTINKYNHRNRPVPLEEVTQDNQLRIETDKYLNIRLNKVENGWVITTTHSLKENYEVSNRVVPDGGDIMTEIEQAIALHKLRG